MRLEYPKNFSRFYDLIYKQLRDEADADFFQKETCLAKGRVLEIGVGTGRHFMQSLSCGVDIYGIDISEEMLNVLYGKLPRDQHYRVSIQDMRDFSFDFSFDLIIAPFRVFMHLIKKEDQLIALNNVWKHLKKNGRFIFDTFVPDLNQIIKGLNNVKDFEGEYEPGKMIRRIVSTNPDLINQIINVTFQIEWEESERLENEIWTTPLRFFFRYELEHLIERSRFKNYRIFGDYMGNDLAQDSREFVMVCRK